MDLQAIYAFVFNCTDTKGASINGIPGIKVWLEISCTVNFGPPKRYIYRNILFQPDFCILQCSECQNKWFLEFVQFLLLFQ